MEISMKLSEKIDEMLREEVDDDTMCDALSEIDQNVPAAFSDGYRFGLNGIKNILEVCGVDIELNK